MSLKKRQHLEAYLFAGEGRVSREKLKKFLTVNDEQLDSLISELRKKYEEINSSFNLEESDGYVLLTVKDEFINHTKNFVMSEFSNSTLKTLAIIAYRSPVKQSEIIKSRGNKSYGHINELIKSGFVEGEDFGNTKILRLTPKFFKYFNITQEELKKSFRGEKT